MIEGILVLLAGLSVGSFLNVCISRLPKGISVVTPPSHCPACGKVIAWFDNIPVLSFLVLGGRCRKCRERIPWRYPAVELASGVFWFFLWRAEGNEAAFWIAGIFCSLLLAASVTDWETGLIPDSVTLLGIGVGLNASFFYPALQAQGAGWAAVLQSGIGMLTGGCLIYVTGAAGNWIFQRELIQLQLEESMGGGDVKLLAMAGAFLGWEKVLLVFFTAPLLALPFALYGRWYKNEAVIPYGPFLSAAAVIQYFYGDSIWRSMILGGKI
ncbi:MAG: prepilin peptidase [Candidatus Omnitrophica bacterium]|nr:prepilin peptidase [Candidatus Omnitrophota bacterium]